MLKILLWVVANDGRFFNGALNILARQHAGIDIVGVTASAPIQLATGGKKIPFIPLAEVGRVGGGYDVLLVVGARQIGMSKVTRTASEFKLPVEKLLGDWIVCIPGFTLDKYRKLQRSRLTIFAQNCFGGLISHTLGLPFRTPTINMFLSADDFIKFLRAPREYMEKPLVLKETRWQSVLKFDYPVVTLGDVDLNMNHYSDFDAAVAKWNARKQRINWYNLFVTMYTEDEKILREFDELPFGKKVCFVPFKSDVDSAWYTSLQPTEERPLWKIVNSIGFSDINCYDLFDMLLYGKKTPLIEM